MHDAVFTNGESGPDIRVKDKTGAIRHLRPENLRFGTPEGGGEATWLIGAYDLDSETHHLFRLSGLTFIENIQS